MYFTQFVPIGLILVTSFVRRSVQDEEIDKELRIWRKVFVSQRPYQLMAVKNVINAGDLKQQRKVLKVLVEAMKTVMDESKRTLELTGFEPGMKFPVDTQTKEALSRILENTAFIAEITLHLPELVSKSIFKKDFDFLNLVRWCVEFTNRTRFYDDVTQNLMYTFSQEMNFVVREPDYMNPFNEESVRRQHEERIMKSMKQATKSKKARTKRGPRLSRSEL